MDEHVENEICEQCFSRAKTMTPGFFGMLRTNPGYDHQFSSARELKEAVESDRVSTALVRAIRPVDQTHCVHEIKIPLRHIVERTPEEIEKIVFDELAMQLKFAIHHEHLSEGSLKGG